MLVGDLIGGDFRLLRAVRHAVVGDSRRAFARRVAKQARSTGDAGLPRNVRTCATPRTGSQMSIVQGLLSSVAAVGLPTGLHWPAPSQASGPLHRSRSLQALPEGAGLCCTTPFSASHVSTVHGLPSSITGPCSTSLHSPWSVHTPFEPQRPGRSNTPSRQRRHVRDRKRLGIADVVRTRVAVVEARHRLLEARAADIANSRLAGAGGFEARRPKRGERLREPVYWVASLDGTRIAVARDRDWNVLRARQRVAAVDGTRIAIVNGYGLAPGTVARAVARPDPGARVALAAADDASSAGLMRHAENGIAAIDGTTGFRRRASGAGWASIARLRYRL